MFIHLISTDGFGRRSYLVFSFYIIQNSQPKVNYPSRLVPIPLVYLFPTYPIHPFPMRGGYYLPFFISLFFSYPPIPEPSTVGGIYVLSCVRSLRTCFVRAHALFRVISNSSLSNQAPGFTLVHSLSVSLFFPFCFYPSSSRSDDLASVHGVSLSDSFFTLSSDAVAIIMIAINDTCAESSVVQ